jgi:hypothetical protein
VAWVLEYKEVYGNKVVNKFIKEGLKLLILYTRTAIITYIKRWVKSERKRL